jgi:hypothetical protein
MEFKQALQTAQFLLDGEFENFAHNPEDYCRSMGWAKDSEGTQKAIEKKDDICPTSEDYNNLAQIISSSKASDAIEAAELNSVSDFLCNCIAGHILN